MSAQAGFFPLFWRADRERVSNTSPPLSKSVAATALYPSVTGAPRKTSDRVLLGRVASTTPDVHPTAPPSPIAETERRLTESKVADALAALPPEQRRTIQLAYFDGLSQSEIAAKTGSPLGTVKMRVKLAVGKLKNLLEDDFS